MRWWASSIWTFLSTLPARGATVFTTSFAAPDRFLSTLPARGATVFNETFSFRFLISIHAPREGSDRSRRSGRRMYRDFYPRSPRGERLALGFTSRQALLFLSTLPARGATGSESTPSQTEAFLSTLPARGATSSSSVSL